MGSHLELTPRSEGCRDTLWLTPMSLGDLPNLCRALPPALGPLFVPLETPPQRRSPALQHRC